MRFSMIDRIISLEAGKSITALKNLTMAEEYLADHFPGFPVMPGVLMLESMVQAGAWLMRYTDDFAHSTILLKQAKAIRFNSFVRPGRTLVVSATVHKWEDSECVVKGHGNVDGTSTVSARLTLESSNLRETNRASAETDKRLVDAMRMTFEQLWDGPHKQDADTGK